jgi:PHD/YefM family antitoxin component YafN of YafNO toxin-antitoxin module
MFRGGDFMPTIKSSTDLRNGYNAISTFCHESREPVFITKNGQGDLAIMSIDVYEELTRKRAKSIEDSRQELYQLLAEGRKAVEEGRTRPLDEVVADMRKRIADGTI